MMCHISVRVSYLTLCLILFLGFVVYFLTCLEVSYSKTNNREYASVYNPIKEHSITRARIGPNELSALLPRAFLNLTFLAKMASFR